MISFVYRADSAEAVHGSARLVRDHDVIVVIKANLPVERAEQQPLGIVRGGQIELAGILKQIDVTQKPRGIPLDVFGGGVQSALHLSLFDLDRLEALLESRARDCSIGGEVDQAIFAQVQFAQMALNSLPLVALGLLAVLQRRCDVIAGTSRSSRRDRITCHMPGNGGLDLMHRQIRKIAVAILSAATEVVLVDVDAIAALHLDVDEAAPDIPGVAAVAPEHSLEEVMMDDVALPAFRTLGEHVLHSEEEFFGDQRTMAAREDFTFEPDDAGVVGVAQHGIELTR